MPLRYKSWECRCESSLRKTWFCLRCHSISSCCQKSCCRRQFLFAVSLPSWTFNCLLNEVERRLPAGGSTPQLSLCWGLVVARSQRVGCFCQVHSALSHSVAGSTGSKCSKHFKVLSYSGSKGPCWDHVTRQWLSLSLNSNLSSFLLGDSSATGEQLRSASTCLHKTCWMFNQGWKTCRAKADGQLHFYTLYIGVH